MRSIYYEVLRNLIFRSIQKETRLSERQVAQLRWEQINGSTIVTQYRREVQMSAELTAALALLPQNGRFVFIGPTPFSSHETEDMLAIKRSFEAENQPQESKFLMFNWGGRRLTKVR